MKTKPSVVVRAAPQAFRHGDDDHRQAVCARRDRNADSRGEHGRPAARRPAERPRSQPESPPIARSAAAHVALPRLPHLTLTPLSAPRPTADDGRARKLAVGALSLLILALASATLLAFTARVERRRVVR